MFIKRGNKIYSKKLNKRSKTIIIKMVQIDDTYIDIDEFAKQIGRQIKCIKESKLVTAS